MFSAICFYLVTALHNTNYSKNTSGIKTVTRIASFEEFIPSDQCWVLIKAQDQCQIGHFLVHIWNWGANKCLVPPPLQYF